MSTEKSLDGQVALITGGSRGLGRAIAASLGNQGASVFFTYRHDVSAAKEVERQISRSGGSAVALKVDVTSRDSVRRGLEVLRDSAESLDILVNNAGVNVRKDFLDTTDDDWNLILETNLYGTFMVCQEAWPLFRSSGGRIVNISSVAAQYHGPRTVPYAVSKAGIISLTKVLARYGAPLNILVNCVAPGLVLTDQTQDEFSSGDASKLLEWTLLRRPTRLENVTSAVSFLVGMNQDNMTGQVLSVSGGAYLG